MRPLLTLALLAASFPSLSPAWAAEPAAGDRPTLSEAGKKKAQENLELLNTNLRSLQDGLTTIQKNERVIADEIRELDQLERDHYELRKRYDSYLALAHREMVRNDAELRRLDEMERKPASDRNAVASERKQRDSWRQDAQPKVGRVETLTRDLQKNLADIQARRGPLRTQLASWKDREREYERAIHDHSIRKSELERMIR